MGVGEGVHARLQRKAREEKGRRPGSKGSHATGIDCDLLRTDPTVGMRLDTEREAAGEQRFAKVRTKTDPTVGMRSPELTAVFSLPIVSRPCDAGSPSLFQDSCTAPTLSFFPLNLSFRTEAQHKKFMLDKTSPHPALKHQDPSLSTLPTYVHAAAGGVS